MKLRELATPVAMSALVLILMSGWSSRVLAQDVHSHNMTQELTAQQQSQASALIKLVRQHTARFQDVTVAEHEGYALQFGCVSGDDAGAMGLHYLNGDLVGSGVIDATRPQAVIYEPTPNGGRRLIGVDYLVLVDTWNSDPKHTSPPELMGQLFHLFDSPNRFGLPPFYTLHVWAWKNNPNGAFVNWHPNVSCETFSAQGQ
ncbi:MAG TPA: hypothetical protein VNW47_16385 [Terriglobales bacterium]|jgi:hypothetical protein|nr:hypothetical protein [Terriglobales bacterium]